MNKIPDFDKLIEPYVNIYTDIETRLILKIASNFRLYKEIDLKNSMQWYLKKIQELGGLSQEAVDIISEYSKIPKKEVLATLRKAGYEPLDTAAIKKANATGNYDIDIEKLLESKKVNEIINNSYNEINDDVFKMINTKAQESFKKAYMDTLNNAYTSIATGAFDYNTAISHALTQLNKDGIQIVSYTQKDGSVRKYTVESCVRRDMLTAIVQTTNKVQDQLTEQMGAEYVEVSSHLGARTRTKYTKHDYEAHDEWQGKVYKVHGSDDKYPNLVEKTGYGEITGLGGVNCRHIKWPFFPGISVPRKDFVDKKANDKAYALSQKQRGFETKIRDYKREIEIGKISQDINKVNKYSSKLQNTFAEYNQFCKNNDLTRDYNRERIFNIKDTNGEVLTKVAYKDVTNDMFNKATPNSHKIQIKNSFVDNNGIEHPIKNKEIAIQATKESDEYRIAQLIENKLGGPISLEPQIIDISNSGKGIHTPDYIWNGTKWDLKTPKYKEDSSNLLNDLFRSSKLKLQCENFVVNLVNFPKITEEEINCMCKRLFFNKYRNWIKGIMIIKDEDIYKIYRQ